MPVLCWVDLKSKKSLENKTLFVYIYIIKHFTNILYNGRGKIYNFSKIAESIVKWQRTEKLYDK